MATLATVQKTDVSARPACRQTTFLALLIDLDPPAKVLTFECRYDEEQG